MTLADVLRLQPDALRSLSDAGGWSLGVVIVVAASLSEALGQSVVLFANRVKPRRFVASIVLTALSYPLGILLLTSSVVLLANLVFAQTLGFRQVLLLAMWSFSPHLFGAFILVPYLGGFIALCLALWSLAIMVTAIYAVSALSLTQAALCLALGWALWQLLRRGTGWPITGVTRWLRTRAAGEKLVTDSEGLEHLFRAEAARLAAKLQAQTQPEPQEKSREGSK